MHAIRGNPETIKEFLVIRINRRSITKKKSQREIRGCEMHETKTKKCMHLKAGKLLTRYKH